MTDFAVQSFCFRGFKNNEQVAELVRKIGLNGIELCGIHVDFNSDTGWDAALKTYRDAAVNVVSIGVERIGTDEAAARMRFEFCKRAGCKVMSVNFMPEEVPVAYRLAEKLAEEYDIKLGIHNHGGYHWLGSTQMLKYVFTQTNPRVGLCLDTAWALAAGEDPHKYVDLFGDRLYSIHVKDFIFGRDRKPQDVVVGAGNIDLPKLFSQLKSKKFAGPYILEYEGDVENPVPALTKCVEAMKAVK